MKQYIQCESVLYFCLFVLAFSLSEFGFSQEYKILTYTNKEGLNNNLIKAVAQDSLGFIWVATDNGLLRFNGKDFYNFTNGLPSNYVKSFFKSHDDWFLAVTDLGIVKLSVMADSVKIETLFKGSTMYTDSLLFYPKLVFEDHTHNLWIADNNSVWLVLDNRLKQYVFDKKNYTINFLRSYSITENNQGEMYVFSETGYSYLYNRQDDEFIEQTQIPKFSSVDDACFIDDKRILIASFDGVYELNISEKAPTVNRLLETDACKIEQLNDSVYFIASWTGGLHTCTFRNQKVVVEKIESLTDLNINNLFIDDKANLWLSSDLGLALAQNKPFRSMSQLLSRIFVQSIDIAPDAHVYCIADKAYSIDKINGELRTRVIFSLSRSGNLSQVAVCKTDPSRLFIATSDAQLYALQNEKVIHKIDLSSYGRVLFFLTCDAKNNLWACLDGCNGVLKISPNFEVELIDDMRGLDSRGIVVRSDATGNLFCGGIGDSTYLFKYDYSAGMFKNVSDHISFEHSPEMVVNDIAFQNGAVFLATTEGVIQKNGDQLTRIDLGEFTESSIRSISCDRNNFIWFSNDQGLYKYKDGTYYI